MALTKFNFKAGINKEETELSNEGGWVDGNFIRFRKTKVEKIGGWIKNTANSFFGKARALITWTSVEGNKFLGVGTTTKYYIKEGNAYNDITPLRQTTAAGDVTFAASNGSSTLTVTDANHGANAGDFVTFSGAAALGGSGNITAAVLNQEYEIATIATVNSYTITAKDTSGSTVTANANDSGNGGSSVVGKYQVNIGTDTFLSGTGWSVNGWGEGSFGSSSSLSANNQLRLWSHDNYGEDLIINPRAGSIYRWVEADGLNTRAVDLSTTSGANLVPTRGLQVLTSETDRHLIVLGADTLNDAGTARTGQADAMFIAFSDQENLLEFEPKTTNTAGSLRLSSGSEIIAGTKTRQEIVVWTDTAIYSMQFIGPPLTFSLNLINEGVGLISPKGFVNSSNGVFFMSQSGFYIYNGVVNKIPCTLQNHVFDDLDVSQAYKCYAGLNAQFSEVWFFYPSLSEGSGEISKYVIYNYEENVWSLGSLTRYAWLDDYNNSNPVASGIANSSNFLYDHESGSNDDESPMSNVFIESGDFDVADGEQFAFIKRIIPDINFLSDFGTSPNPAINVVLKKRNSPADSLTADSTSQIDNTTTRNDVRTRGRQFVLRFESDDDLSPTARQKDFKWRLGATRLDVNPSGRR
jgi:hypothetical protein